MTDVTQLPADDYVPSLNGWRKRIVLPAADSASTPLVWGNFAVTVTGPNPPAGGVVVATDRTGLSPVVTLSVPAGSLAVGSFHWFLSESAVYLGDTFLSGTVHVEALDAD